MNKPWEAQSLHTFMVRTQLIIIAPVSICEFIIFDLYCALVLVVVVVFTCFDFFCVCVCVFLTKRQNSPNSLPLFKLNPHAMASVFWRGESVRCFISHIAARAAS